MSARASPRGQRKRRRVYVDGHLQGRFALGLVLFELLLFALAWLYLYDRFIVILDSQPGAAEGIAAPMMSIASELALVVLICGLFNACALLLAHGLWARHVRAVLASLRARIERVDALDLRADPAWAREKEVHRLVDLCDRWVESERRRMLAVRIAAARLPRPLPGSAQPRESRDALLAVQEAASQLKRGSKVEPTLD